MPRTGSTSNRATRRTQLEVVLAAFVFVFVEGVMFAVKLAYIIVNVVR